MMNLQPEIFKDSDTTFMVVAAIRYCHGRRTYAPSLMVDWIKRYWDYIDSNTQDLIKKESHEYVNSKLDIGDECDRLTWESFDNWLKEQ